MVRVFTHEILVLVAFSQTFFSGSESWNKVFFSFIVLISPFFTAGWDYSRKSILIKWIFWNSLAKGKLTQWTRKKPYFKTQSKIFFYSGLLRKSTCCMEIPAVSWVIKKEVKFPGAIKKNHMEFPWILVFILLFGVFRNSCQKISKGHHQGW